MRALIALSLFLGLLALTAGCGGGGDKAIIPEKFSPKPDRPPSAGGVPDPGAGKNAKGKGGSSEQ